MIVLAVIAVIVIAMSIAAIHSSITEAVQSPSNKHNPNTITDPNWKYGDPIPGEEEEG